MLIIGTVLLAGCALTGRTWHGPWPAQAPPRVHLTDVAFHAQSALQCGPAALAMVLQHSGRTIPPEDLASQVYTPGREGSLQSGLVSAARRNQRIAYPIQGLACLFAALTAGQPVIILQNLGLSWLPRWHYAVAVGYDLPQGRIILHTGKEADRSVALATFDRTWQRADRWGLLVLPAGRMPVCAEERAYLQAALGLQQAGHATEALSAFRAAANHWSDSAQAHMALGNALYACGDKTAAAHAFEQAARQDSSNGAAYNNLAHVLAETGAMQAAENAALRAVELGGPHASIYRRTLEEIQRSGPTR